MSTATATAPSMSTRDVGRGDLVLHQYYLGCLSQASYLIGDRSSGTAIVVDPRRDIDEYLDDARRLGLTIHSVAETHVHADFVSGHLELAAATGASILFGSGASVGFDHEIVADGDRIELGEVAVEVLATPGHTPESICLVVRHGDRPYAVLTGDTLFIGDVGRTDLTAAGDESTEDMAGRLYHSIRSKVLTLPPDCLVLPGHGAGSACGGQLSANTMSTIGLETATNAALAVTSESDFVAAVTKKLEPPPAYFFRDVILNRSRHQLHTQRAPDRLSIEAALRRRDSGATVVDVRDADEFAPRHLVGSLNIGLNGRFAEWMGSLVDPDADLVLLCRPGNETLARTRCARVGFDQVAGWVAAQDLVNTPGPELAQTARLAWHEFQREVDSESPPVVVDVRTAAERSTGSVRRSMHIPLSELRSRLPEIPHERPIVVYCAGGYRSSIAASLLRGVRDEPVVDVHGGFRPLSQVSTSSPSVVPYSTHEPSYNATLG